MSDYDPIENFIKNLKMRRLQETSEQRLKIAVELIDFSTKLLIQRVIKELSCSHEKAIKILREREMRVRGTI